MAVELREGGGSSTRNMVWFYHTDDVQLQYIIASLLTAT